MEQITAQEQCSQTSETSSNDHYAHQSQSLFEHTFLSFPQSRRQKPLLLALHDLDEHTQSTLLPNAPLLSCASRHQEQTQAPAHSQQEPENPRLLLHPFPLL